MLEIVVEGLQNRISELIRLFNNLLQDPQSLDVRLVTVRALGTLAGYIDLDDKPDIVSWFSRAAITPLTFFIQKSYQALIPQMLQVASDALTSNNEEGAKNCFDTLSTLLIIVSYLLHPYHSAYPAFNRKPRSWQNMSKSLFHSVFKQGARLISMRS